MLSKLGSDELLRFGFNLCDLLDLFDLVQQYLLNEEKDEAVGDIDHVSIEEGSTAQPNIPTQGSSSCPPSPQTVNAADKSSDDACSDVNNTSDLSYDYFDSDDEVFNGFAERSEIHKLKPYDRFVFKNNIDKYQQGVSTGLVLPLPRPFNNSTSSIKPSLSKSAGSEAGCSSGASNKTVKSRLSSLQSNSSEAGPSSSKGEKSRRSSKSNNSSQAGSSVMTTPTSPKDSEEPRHKRQKSSSKKELICVGKKPSRAELLEEHKAFLSNENLTPKDKKEIRMYLEHQLNPRYSIKDMLSKATEEDETVGLLQAKLENDGVVFEGDLSKLVTILMESLYSKTSNPNMVTAHMREALAVCLVATFPNMAHEILSSEEKPWSWIYDRKQNKGKLANYHANKQKTCGAARMRGGGSKPKKQKKSDTPEKIPEVLLSTVDDLSLSKDARYLRLIVPDDRHKKEIEDLMEKSYEERRRLVQDPKCPVRLLIEAYPHLKSFGGIMIDQEFERIHRGKGSLLIRNFGDLVPKLLKIAKDNPQKYQQETCFKFQDSSLNALVILAHLLPKAKRVSTYNWEKNMDTNPLLKDFFDLVPAATDIRTHILERREKENTPVQPFLVAKGTSHSIQCIALVLGDNEFINLPRSTMPLRAVDLLIKTNYVLSTQFFLGWKYMFRFLIANVYKLKLDNPRHSAFTEQFKFINDYQIE